MALTFTWDYAELEDEDGNKIAPYYVGETVYEAYALLVVSGTLSVSNKAVSRVTCTSFSINSNYGSFTDSTINFISGKQIVGERLGFSYGTHGKTITFTCSVYGTAYDNNGNTEDIVETKTFSVYCNSQPYTVTEPIALNAVYQKKSLTMLSSLPVVTLTRSSTVYNATVYYRYKTSQWLNWSTSCPSQTCSGSWPVQYYIKGDSTIAAYGTSTSPKSGGTAQISQAPVTLQWGNTSFPYNGQSQKAQASIKSGVYSGDTVNVTTSGSITNVGDTGSSTATLSGAQSSCYTIPDDQKSVSLTITPIDYDMSGVSYSNATATYNGENQVAPFNATMPTGIDGSSPSATVPTGGGKNASTTPYTCTVSFTSGSNNYNAPADMTATITINKCTLSNPSLTDYQKTYNGGTQYPTLLNDPGALASHDGFLSARDQGTYKNYWTLVDSNNYQWTTPMTDDPKTAFDWWVIYQKDISGATITLEKDSFTYNATEHTVTINSATIDNLTITYSIESGTNKGTNASDDYKLQINGTGNFTGSATKDWSIDPLSLEDAEITFSNALTYTGEEQTILIQSVVKDNITIPNSNYYITDGSDKGTNAADDYSIEITATLYATNFTGSATATWTIAPKQLESLTWNDTHTYDGKPYTGTIKSVEGLIEGDTCTFTYTHSTIDGRSYPGVKTYADSGLATTTATSTGNSNYSLPDEHSTLLYIEQLEATLQWGFKTGTDETKWDTVTLTYDGVAHTPKCKVTNRVSGDTFTITLSPSGSLTNVSDTTEVSIAISGGASGNYKLPDTASQIFTISPLSISDFTVTLGTALEYNGSEQTQTVASVTKDSFSATFTVSGNKATNVKTNDDYTLTVTGNGNFGGSTTAEWNINPLNLSTATITLDKNEFTYDQTMKTATIKTFTKGTFNIPNTVYTVDGHQHKGHGENYVLTATAKADATNYSGAATASWKIKRCTLGGFTWEDNFDYNGEYHTGIATPTGYYPGDVFDLEYTTTTIDQRPEPGVRNYGDVARTTVTATGNDDYELPTNPYTDLSINPLTVELKWGLNIAGSIEWVTSKTYTGSPYTPVCVVNNLVPNDTCNITLDRPQAITNVADANPKTITATGLTGSDAGNYELPTTPRQDFYITPQYSCAIPSSSYSVDFTGWMIPITDVYSSNNVIVTGDSHIYRGTNYTGTATPAANYGWTDRTMDQKSFTWSIAKITPVVSITNTLDGEFIKLEGAETKTITYTIKRYDGDELVDFTLDPNYFGEGGTKHAGFSLSLRHSSGSTPRCTIDGMTITGSSISENKEDILVLDLARNGSTITNSDWAAVFDSKCIKVVAKVVQVPTWPTDGPTYNAAEQAYLPTNWDDTTSDKLNKYCNIEGNTATNRSATNYTATVSLKNTAVSKWSTNNINPITKTWNIVPKSVSVALTSYNGTYDAQSHGVSYSINGLLGKDTSNIITNPSNSFINYCAATTVTLTGLTNINYRYSGMAPTATVQIKQRAVTIVWDVRTKAFTGSQLNPEFHLDDTDGKMPLQEGESVIGNIDNVECIHVTATPYTRYVTSLTQKINNVASHNYKLPSLESCSTSFTITPIDSPFTWDVRNAYAGATSSSIQYIPHNSTDHPNTCLPDPQNTIGTVSYELTSDSSTGLSWCDHATYGKQIQLDANLQAGTYYAYIIATDTPAEGNLDYNVTSLEPVTIAITLVTTTKMYAVNNATTGKYAPAMAKLCLGGTTGNYQWVDIHMKVCTGTSQDEDGNITYIWKTVF